jgi:phosphoribosylformylglycinamidine synthase
MAIHEIRVTPIEKDPLGHELLSEAKRSFAVVFDEVRTAKVYRIEGISKTEAALLAEKLFTDPVSEKFTLNQSVDYGKSHVVEVGYKPGVMNPEEASIQKAAEDLGVKPKAVGSSTEYAFYGVVDPVRIETVVKRLLVNPTVQHVVSKAPDTLIFKGTPGTIQIVPIRDASEDELMALSKDKLFLDAKEMGVIQSYFRELGREPTDCELEIIAARWSEHCGHKTFNAKVMVDGVEKQPLFDRIKTAAKRNFGDLVVSAFGDNSGVIRFYDGQAICGKVETHNSPSAIEPYGGAMTGSGGVFRDIMGTGQGAETVLSTDMFCFAPTDLDESKLPSGTLRPDYLQHNVVRGVRDYGNRMGIPTANGSVHYHPDFRAKPSVIVGAYGFLPEARAQKGEAHVGDLVVIIGGRTGRDGIHGATFSSGEMTSRTADINSSAVQIGNAIEEKRMFDALLEARDLDYIRAMTDCGAAGFSSAIGEMGEGIGVTVDISKAPLKYSGLAPWEIWLSESQERMVAAIPPDKIKDFLAVCATYNVEATVIGTFDGSHTLTVTYGDQTAAELSYDFLENGLPQRTMQAHYEREAVLETRPSTPATEHEWVDRLQAVLAHGNVCSKEPIVRQYDHGVRGGNVVSPFGGKEQDGPNDAVVLRLIPGKPYGMVQSHGMNPILNRLDPYEGTIWAITEAAANYVAVGGNISEAAAVGNYIWPYPDIESMGTLDRSVDAATHMMDVLGVPVISGKDSLSSTYRGADGEVIKIPPVYCASLFGRIPDIEKTTTSDLKRPGTSKLILVGTLSDGLGGSTYYDVAAGSSNDIAMVDLETMPEVLSRIHEQIVAGRILACHDVSEGGLISTVSEMCFGGGCGADIRVPKERDAEAFLFSETAGCLVVEVGNDENLGTLFSGLPRIELGRTTERRDVNVNQGDKTLFTVPMPDLKAAWQQPMKEVFHG